MEHVDVLIVGAGPVGVLAANLLGARGLSVLIVDKAPDVLAIPRAIALDNEVLRILQATGLAEVLARDMPSVPKVEMVSPRFGLLSRVNAAGSVDGHPRIVMFHQPSLERSLREGLRRYREVELRCGVECLFHDDRGDAVIARLSCGLVQARYLLACDGASSPIRQRLGIPLIGSTYQEDWLIVDAAQPPTPISHVEFICDPKRPIAHMLAPGGGQRWEFMLAPHETREEMERPAKVAELMRPWGDVWRMQVQRTAVYRFHARVAQRFRVGRVFLLGDAAHLTPPFAGQGLCAGIRDAYNLSWKLAAVIQGRADARVLESYETERKPHATRMVRLAQFMGQLIMPRSALRAWLQAILLRLLQRVPGLRTLVTEMKIKPQNRYALGLFLRGMRGDTRLAAGGMFPQALVRTSAGRLCWSDEVMGPAPVLVGIGLDPETVLTSASAAHCERLGIARLTLRHAQQPRLGSSPSVEDLIGSLLAAFGRDERLALLRPDRIVVAAGSAKDAARWLPVALHLLEQGAPAPAKGPLITDPLQAAQP